MAPFFVKVPCIPEVEAWIFLYPDLLPQAQVNPSQFLHQALCQTRLYLSLYAPLSRFLLPKEAEPVPPLILFLLFPTSLSTFYLRFPLQMYSIPYRPGTVPSILPIHNHIPGRKIQRSFLLPYCSPL